MYTTYGIVIQNTEDGTGWVEGPFTYLGAEQRHEELIEAYPEQFMIVIRDYRRLMREGSV